MRTILVTGSDTGVGKTRVVAALARLLAVDGARVQIVKVVETGRAADDVNAGDAASAQRMSETNAVAFTLATFPAPLSPPVAAALAGEEINFDDLLSRLRALDPCDWQIVEGAGGIATPLDDHGRDWVDFAVAIKADATVVVVPDRLGAINQARLANGRAKLAELHAGIWLNAVSPVDPAVAESNRSSLRALGVPLWAEQAHSAMAPDDAATLLAHITKDGTRPPDGFRPASVGQTRPEAGFHPNKESGALSIRVQQMLDERTQLGLRRWLRITRPAADVLNLADNDYLALANDPAVVQGAAAAIYEHGASASASPLITGWREPHQRLVERLCTWHDFPSGLLWSSGFAANSAVLGVLPARGDLVLADRLIHHSMIAGLLRSGARLRRYEHLNLDQLETLLLAEPKSVRSVFVVTESVFSMDGDFPDLARMAELKRRHDFCWIVDEAHGLGWYGPAGAGLARERGVERDVDVLVGTLGKTLASGGAYTLFRNETLRDYVINTAGEFIYSTALPPANAAAAEAALTRVCALASQQSEWRTNSRKFRADLRGEGWSAPEGDSPIVPVRLDTPEAAVSLAAALREAGILAAAVRPPTVPAGTSRLRFSLKRTFGGDDAERVIKTMNRWRAAP